MTLPQPEWAAINNMTPPSKWAVLADRIAQLEHAVDALTGQLNYTVDRIQDLPGVAEDDQLWWHTDNLRIAVERLPTDVEQVDTMLADLFREFGPKVKKSFGQRYIQWREGPWSTLGAKDDDDG